VDGWSSLGAGSWGYGFVILLVSSQVLNVCYYVFCFFFVTYFHRSCTLVIGTCNWLFVDDV